jgi:two-component system phosphate regulon sensor histidine kinase PhoR
VRALVAAFAVLPLTAALIVLVVTDAAVAAVIVASATAGLLAALVHWRLGQEIALATATARAMAGGGLPRRPDDRSALLTGKLEAALDQMSQGLATLVRETALDRGRLTAALNGTVDAIVAVDADGDIRFANQAAAGLIGGDQASLIGRPLGWVLPEPNLVDLVRGAVAEHRPGLALIERSNRQLYQATASPVTGGGDWAALILFHDQTEVRRVEQVRRDFIGNVSHELRTPLASVKAVIETLEGGALDDREVALEFLGRANAEIDRLVQMVEELLVLSKLESGEAAPVRERVDLAEIAAEAVERLRPEAERRELSLTLDVAAGLPSLLGDAGQLERALVNLIQNALKFTPAGGSIEVVVTPGEAGLRVAVRDSGVGIEAKDLPRVFERFYKGDHSRGSAGTGLGLAIVKHTIEAHGGTVQVESQPGRGSTFSFTLPSP